MANELGPTFIIVEANAILFRADNIDDGLAFMEGRQGGVLYRLLCGPRTKPSRVHRGKQAIPAKTKTPGQRRAS